MQLFDTHCHIHFPDYQLDPEEVIDNAKEAGVTRLMVVGCTLPDSKLAVEFAKRHDNIWAAIGLHPHEGSEYIHDDIALQQFRDLANKPKVVAVGETGLDYYYMHSSKEDQEKLLRFQLDLAVEHDLPLIFHVREAFEDFWKIFDEYQGLRGVVHSFSAHPKELEEILARDLYVGLNGIMTFTKDKQQLEAAKAVPLKKLLLETDAPFLTPAPYRGTICESKHVLNTAEFLAGLRGEELDTLATASTANAMKLFKL
jgi:TatD DNase family protein